MTPLIELFVKYVLKNIPLSSLSVVIANIENRKNVTWLFTTNANDISHLDRKKVEHSFESSLFVLFFSVLNRFVVKPFVRTKEYLGPEQTLYNDNIFAFYEISIQLRMYIHGWH